MGALIEQVWGIGLNSPILVRMLSNNQAWNRPLPGLAARHEP